MSFSHLHVHTTYSMFDGLATAEDLFKRAEELGQKGLAITDHGTMSGAPEFLRCARSHPSVKPVVGCEVYLASEGKRNFHLILLAKNLEGYHNLVRLCSEAATVGMYVRPRATHAMLEKYHDGLIAMSACIGGEIPQALLSGDADKARDLVRWYKNLFGNDFYLEVSCHPSRKEGYSSDLLSLQDRANDGLIALATDFGIKVVATNDVHFVLESDAEAHDVLLCISTKKTLAAPDRFQYTGEEFLKSEAEMRELFSQEYLDNTDEVLAKIETYDIFQAPDLPEYPIPDGFTGADEYLGSIARKGLAEYWKRRGEACPPCQREALERALGQAARKGWSNYYLILWDLVREVKGKGFIVGPGRGSSADSVLNFALGITEINPGIFGLMHSRFASDRRVVLPDIDLDFDSDGYEYAKSYLRAKYGEDHVVGMATFGRGSHRTALQECFRVYGLDETRLAPILQSDSVRTFFSSLPSCLQDDENLFEWYLSATDAERKAFAIEDRIRHHITSKEPHSSALLLSRKPVTEYLPVERYSEGGEPVIISQYDAHYAEDYGVMRQDLLRLPALDIIREASKSCCIPDTLDDEKTLDLFRRGDTDGIFMFEPEGIRKHLLSLSPQSFTDLVALNTLYRPGLMENIPQFCEAARYAREDGIISVPVIGLEEILSETYGFLLYQEQLMRIAMCCGGYSEDDADFLRKAVGKKLTAVLDGQHLKFVEGAIMKGLSRTDAENLWRLIESRGPLLFCKAHSVSYTMVSYRLAYLKVHSPEIFYSAAW